MPRLTRSGLLHRLRDDRGATATLVAVLLFGGVLLGMGAVVVDVGQIYVEREELQSGADAAARAVARECAVSRDACTTAATAAVARKYARGNARDHEAATEVCGGPGLPLPRCAGATNCIPAPPSAAGLPYVEVRTSTRTGDGGTVLPAVFAQALTGGGSDGPVRACARVAWGQPGQGLGLMLNHCGWEEATDEGARFAAPPPYDGAEPDDRLEEVFEASTILEPGDSAYGCHYTDSRFGWLHDLDGDCMREVDPPDHWLHGRDGEWEVSDACRAMLADARDNARVQLVPIYDQAVYLGFPLWADWPQFRIAGVAGFVITGYRVEHRGHTRSESSWLTGRSCPGSRRSCVMGFFVREVLPWSDELTGGDPYGIAALKTIG